MDDIILGLINRIATLTKKVYDEIKPSLAVFFYLSKAFDSLHYDTLLRMPNIISFRGKVSDVLKPFIMDQE